MLFMGDMVNGIVVIPLAFGVVFMSETSVGVADTLFLYEFDGRVDDNDHLGLS